MTANAVRRRSAVRDKDAQVLRAETHHPEFFQMACIVAVQILNAADWSVILPISSNIADFLGLGGTYSGWLIASLYMSVYEPFIISAK